MFETICFAGLELRSGSFKDLEDKAVKIFFPSLLTH
jgi:hypothetical protein